MSSDQEVNIVAPTRVSNKLTLDSEQQERREQQQREIEQEHQRRKQQKRKRREEAQRLEQEKIKQQQEKQKKYDQPEMMFEEDSDEGIEFRRVVKKIKRQYPDQVNKHEVSSKRRDKFIVPDNEDDEDEESESVSDDDENSESEPKSEQKKIKKQRKEEKKVQKKVQKKQKRPAQKKPVEKKKVQVPVKKEKIKVQAQNDKKEHLVKQVSIRWWYALPEWPPANFDYERKLKQSGYRLLPADKFKLEDDVVNGLQKVMAVDGYKGVYRSKTKLIDVRPKQSAPTLSNFRNKSMEELTDILRKALNVQIDQLKQVKYQQRGEPELLAKLQRLQNKLK